MTRARSTPASRHGIAASQSIIDLRLDAGLLHALELLLLLFQHARLFFRGQALGLGSGNGGFGGFDRRPVIEEYGLALVGSAMQYEKDRESKETAESKESKREGDRKCEMR